MFTKLHFLWVESFQHCCVLNVHTVSTTYFLLALLTICSIVPHFLRHYFLWIESFRIVDYVLIVHTLSKTFIFCELNHFSIVDYVIIRHSLGWPLVLVLHGTKWHWLSVLPRASQKAAPCQAMSQGVPTSVPLWTSCHQCSVIEFSANALASKYCVQSCCVPRWPWAYGG